MQSRVNQTGSSGNYTVLQFGQRCMIAPSRRQSRLCLGPVDIEQGLCWTHATTGCCILEGVLRSCRAHSLASSAYLLCAEGTLLKVALSTEQAIRQGRVPRVRHRMKIDGVASGDRKRHLWAAAPASFPGHAVGASSGWFTLALMHSEEPEI